MSLQVGGWLFLIRFVDAVNDNRCIHDIYNHHPLSYPIWGGDVKMLQYNTFLLSPPHFSKILENWGGGNLGEKKSNKCCGRISQVFDPLPPLKDIWPFF